MKKFLLLALLILLGYFGYNHLTKVHAPSLQNITTQSPDLFISTKYSPTLNQFINPLSTMPLYTEHLQISDDTITKFTYADAETTDAALTEFQKINPFTTKFHHSVITSNNEQWINLYASLPADKQTQTDNFTLEMAQQNIQKILPPTEYSLMKSFFLGDNNITLNGKWTDNTLKIYAYNMQGNTPNIALPEALWHYSDDNISESYKALMDKISTHDDRTGLIARGMVKGFSRQYFNDDDVLQNIITSIEKPFTLVVDSPNETIAEPQIALIVDIEDADNDVVKQGIASLTSRLKTEKVSVEMPNGETREEIVIAENARNVAETRLHAGMDYQILHQKTTEDGFDLFRVNVNNNTVLTNSRDLLFRIMEMNNSEAVASNNIQTSISPQKVTDMMQWFYPVNYDPSAGEILNPLDDNPLIQWLIEYVISIDMIPRAIEIKLISK